MRCPLVPVSYTHLDVYKRQDTLSEEIQNVSSIAGQVEGLVSEAENMINHGMQMVQTLGCLLYTSRCV